MTAFTYRMGAGSPGDVTRIHPGSIRAFLNDASGQAPLSYFGQAALFDGTHNAIRAVNNSADYTGSVKTVSIAGITVRPYPTQDNGSASPYYGAVAYGGGGPVAGGITDILAQGSILVTQNQPAGTYAAASALGGAVYVRVVAGTIAGWTTALPVGGFEAVADPFSAAYQIIAANAYWNGPADQFGVAEITLID